MIVSTMDNFKLAIKEKKVVIFCAGEYCMRFLNRLDEYEIHQISFIVDNDPDKQGISIYNIPVKEPSEIKKLPANNTVVVIASENNIPNIYKQVCEMGEFEIMVARILINDVFSQVAKELYKSQDDIIKITNLLYDEKSKWIYNEAIKRRMLYGECDFSDLIIKGDAEYRLSLAYQKELPKDEIILDCGAYNGDTLKKFVDTFGPKLKKIYCFECLVESLEKLSIVLAHIKNREYYPEVIIMPYAISDHVCKMKFAIANKQTGSFLLENREFAQSTLWDSDYVDVEVTTLDSVIPDNEKISLIKMDIEGSEYEALHGAEHIIKRWKPKLAISIYHCGEDYTRIPLYINELVPEYKMAVRHHNKNHCDTDLYCWIEE